MEVKINREIREYTESMFFGLSLRQFIFSLSACVVAVITYFLLKPLVGLETTSWLCILVAIPFAVIGFLKYNGMHAEEFILAWIRSEIVMPKTLTFGESNFYYGILKDAEVKQKKNKRIVRKIFHRRERRKDRNDKDTN